MMMPPLVKKTLASVVTRDTAPALASMKASDELQHRVDLLAEKSTAGTITTAEGEEYDELLHWVYILSELKVHAMAMVKDQRGN